MTDQLLCSTIKVTLGGEILVDYTDYMEFEPRLVREPITQITRALRASFGKANHRGGVVHSWEFSRVTAHADILAAQRALLQFAETVDALEEGSATIEFNAGAHVHTLANAAVGPVQSRAEHKWAVYSIRLIGGQLSTTT